MADSPVPILEFVNGCGDCGFRTVALPLPLPKIGDDFDWDVRDYDGFRLFMLEELAARFPERRRWTPADMEVVIVEALSVVLDQLSDKLDRVFAESFLETARQPQSVQRLLSFIGYDAIALADSNAGIPDAVPLLSENVDEMRLRLKPFHTGLLRYLNNFQSIVEQLTPAQQVMLQNFLENPNDATEPELAIVQLFLEMAPALVERIQHDALYHYWSLHPRAMNNARQAGPRSIHTQRRMVTAADYAVRLQDHPLVLFAHGFSRWTGSWSTIYIACLLHQAISLDTPINDSTMNGSQALMDIQKKVNDFHRKNKLKEVDWNSTPNARGILRFYLDVFRMSGQEVFIQDAEKVGINITLSLRISAHYFQSEIRRAVEYHLSNQMGGFFEPGKLQFGQDLYASDIIEVVMALDGVEAVCLNRFKRVGKQYFDQSDNGRIKINGYEVAVCNNLVSQPLMGILRITLHGGQRG